MSEGFVSNSLESEIAELSRQIEEKKRALEASRGIVHEKEMVAETVAEHFYPTPAPISPVSLPASDVQSTAPVQSTPTARSQGSSDYLDVLSPEAVEAVNGYISLIPAEGIRKTVGKIQTENPFLMDAFHDALVTRLYEELKARGIVK